MRTNMDVETQKQGYNLLYPAYGTYVGGNLAQVFDSSYLLAVRLGFVIPGHIAGRIKSAFLNEEDITEEAEDSPYQPVEEPAEVPADDSMEPGVGSLFSNQPSQLPFP